MKFFRVVKWNKNEIELFPIFIVSFKGIFSNGINKRRSNSKPNFLQNYLKIFNRKKCKKGKDKKNQVGSHIVVVFCSSKNMFDDQKIQKRNWEKNHSKWSKMMENSKIIGVFVINCVKTTGKKPQKSEEIFFSPRRMCKMTVDSFF